MNVLAFDTALEACSAAVLRTDGGRRLARAHERLGRGHGERLMGMIGTVLAEAGIDYRRLDRIAVTVGPGTFTGTRIGVATARGLALVLGVAVVGATTLQVMAHQARQERTGCRDQALAVAIDARRGQLYIQCFGADGAPLAGPAVSDITAAAHALPVGVAVAVGSGAAALAETARRLGRRLDAVLPDLQPDAAALAELALSLSPATAPVAPLYLRPADAKPQARALA